MAVNREEALLARLESAAAPPATGHRPGIAGRLAYVAAAAPPFASDGGVLRTHGIAAALAARGFEVYVFTRPGFPWDLPGLAHAAEAGHRTVDGVRYIHIRAPAGGDADFTQAYAERFRVFRPSLVIAASGAASAPHALLAARQAGLPFVYELRDGSDGEYTAASAGRARLESALAKSAERVVVASAQAQQALARLGVEPCKIVLLPDPQPADPALWQSLAEPLGAALAALLPGKAYRPAAAAAAPIPARGPYADLKVACVMDEFTELSYQNACQLRQLSPAAWEAELALFQPDLLFIESAWGGEGGLWSGKVARRSQELVGVVEWCRRRRIPSVFWNKEDPIHFETFINTAKLFDFVFTTDIDCIAGYKTLLRHPRVYLLPFACNPATANPVEKYPRKDAFCFAGAYYTRYPERIRDLDNFRDELVKFRPLEIFDRNFGKADPNYQFPPEYQPYIVGNLPFAQIDRAYKGYRYAVNLNSVKQSLSMFARRAYELLACNTLTVSNYSHGLRRLFGGLVIASDNGGELLRRLQALGEDQTACAKFRLAGLRKVMREHTYTDRLAYVMSKVEGGPVKDDLPDIAVLARVETDAQLDIVLAAFRRQDYPKKKLLLAAAAPVRLDALPAEEGVAAWREDAAQDLSLGQAMGAAQWLAGWRVEDYYGPAYLQDLALATRYSDAQAIGKSAHYACLDGIPTLAGDGGQYRLHDRLPARRALLRRDLVGHEALAAWARGLDGLTVDLPGGCLAIDEFNYCQDGARQAAVAAVAEVVGDLAGLDAGMPLAELLAQAEAIAMADAFDGDPQAWKGEALRQIFDRPAQDGLVRLSVEQGVMRVESSLPDGQHAYLHSSATHAPAALGAAQGLRMHLDALPGLDVQLAVYFLDAAKNSLGHIVKPARTNIDAPLPEGTAWLRFALRAYASGSAAVRGLYWGHRAVAPPALAGRADCLLLTNQYPAYEDLYRNGFVHSRVLAYRRRGVAVDVFRLNPDQENGSFYEFQDIDVAIGGQASLRKLLAQGRHRAVLVHFLDEAMWSVLREHIGRVNVYVWVHGAEIQPWHRRSHNYQTDAERASAQAQSAQRMAFWRGVLRPMHKNLKLVFVSRYFAEEVMEDYGFRIPENQYAIIHNPIDTGLFSYQEKPAAQRKKILSIRPFASRKYANDLSVKTIQMLARKPWFDELEFRIIGDGVLFDETLAPLRAYKNVTVEKKFLTQAEIAALHKHYGVFLCPTRMDAQGVSRDEAMASGLVPVTCAVAAIPEFVDGDCGILAGAEDAAAMAEGISRLCAVPAKFARLSQNAAARVRRQSGHERVIPQELALFAAAADRPPSFLSFDVEALPGRATQDHIERLVWGRFGGGEYGIARISHILKQYGIKGNFLIDFSACVLYGDHTVQAIAQYLLDQGHEVHAHLHSEWLVRKWGIKGAWQEPTGMDQLDGKLNAAFLAFTAFKYRALTGLEPMLFRAGGFKFNAATVAAAAGAGFTVFSNFNSERHAASWRSADPRALRNEAFRWNEQLLELPVDLSPEPLSLGWERYLSAFDRVQAQKTLKTFNLTLHSWSLLTRGDGQYFTGHAPAHEEALHKICAHLQAHTEPLGYREFIARGLAVPAISDAHCSLAPTPATAPVKSCALCGAVHGLAANSDVCPGCGGRARHRQILDVLARKGDVFAGRTVLACHANPLERQAFLGKAARLINFDICPLDYADLQMDIQSMDKIEDASFDAFLAVHVLNHVADDRKALNEIHRVLKPGGLALLTVPCRQGAATEPCDNVAEHYGLDALQKYGVGTYRRYGLQDATQLFGELFSVAVEKGFDHFTDSEDFVFLLTKTSTGSAGA